MSDTDKREFFKAAEGRTVPQEDGKPWPAAGAYASLDSRYTRRRVSDGDLVKARPTKAAEAADPEAPAAAAEAAAESAARHDDTSAGQQAAGKRKG